tara:strand:- start:231 stop:1880 length:1650 start_codon:yes stop_codon:yes gene_type:complete
MEVRDAQFYDGTIATDTPVMRENGEEEVLVMHPRAIKLHTKEVPLLENHNHDKQIGIVENIRLVGKKLMAQIRFASDAYSQQLKADVDDNIRQNLSIGYRILDYFYENGKKIVNEFSIHEVSLVPIPADQNSGIGRSMPSYAVRNIYFENTMKDENLSRSQARKLREEISEIRALGRRHNLSDLADEYIDSGSSVEQFRSAVLKEIANTQPLDTPSMSSYESNTRDYSVIKALKGIDDVTARGYEWEVSQNLQRGLQGIQPNSVTLDTRTMVGSSDVVQTSVDSRIQDFIQARSIVMNLGAQTFNGLQGNLTIPRGTSASGATVLATDGTTQAAQTDLTFSSVTLEPTRIADVVPLSYGLLEQSNPDMESYVRRTIAMTFAQTLDDQVIGGSGSSGNVTGILNASGINTVSCGGSDPAFANILSCLEKLGEDNIYLDNLKWIVHPNNISNLSTAVKYSSTASPLLEMEVGVDNQVGTMLGYPVFATSKISEDNYLLGDFSHLALGFWGGINVAMNPFFDDRRFISSLNAIYTFDSQVINPTAFCKMTKA